LDEKGAGTFFIYGWTKDFGLVGRILSWKYFIAFLRGVEVEVVY
jgi:hypothetical protein